MSAKKIMTTDSGAPIDDDRHSQTAGPSGPILLQDHHLMEKHARGAGAHCHFEVTADVTRWTRAKFLAQVGKRTETFVRTSRVAAAVAARRRAA